MARPLIGKAPKASSLFKNRDWIALAPFAGASFLLAYFGFSQCTSDGCPDLTSVEIAEKSLNLVRGQGNYKAFRDPWALVAAQWLLPGVALFATAKLFLIGLRRDVRVAFARRSRDHVIVCGLGETGQQIVELLRSEGERVVAVDLDSDSAGAATADTLGAPTIRGDGSSAAVLRIAGVRRARAVIVCTGNDSVNLETALRCREIAKERTASRPLLVIPEMRTGWLYDWCARHGTVSFGSQRVATRFLNTYENAGRVLLRSAFFTEIGRLRPDLEDLVIVGFGDMGRDIAAQALQTTFALPGRRMRIVALDAKPDAARAAFLARYPGAEEVAEISCLKAQIVADQPASWDTAGELLASTSAAAVIVCVPKDDEALFAASKVRAALDHQGLLATPVYVRIANRRRLAELVAAADGLVGLGPRLIPFGGLAELLSTSVLFDSDIDAIARATHEAYLAASGSRPDAERAGSRAGWDEIPEVFKRSNRLFADHLEVKLRWTGLRSAPASSPRPLALTGPERERLAEAEHERWLVERRMAGWVAGPERDDLRQVHPLLVPWADLPDVARERVRAAVDLIPAALALVGREVRRETVAVVSTIADLRAATEAHGRGDGTHLVLEVDADEASVLDAAFRSTAGGGTSVRLASREGRLMRTGGLGTTPEVRALVAAGLDGWREAPANVAPETASGRRSAVEVTRTETAALKAG